MQYIYIQSIPLIHVMLSKANSYIYYITYGITIFTLIVFNFFIHQSFLENSRQNNENHQYDGTCVRISHCVMLPHYVRYIHNDTTYDKITYDIITPNNII